MRKIEKHQKLVFFLTYLAIVFVACAGCGRDNNVLGITGHRGEALKPVASGIITNSGGGDCMTYGLYALVEPPGDEDGDFLFVLRNVSAKSIDLESVKIDNFRLQDSRGRLARMVLHSLPRGVGWGDATSLQICAIDFTNLSFPLVFSFKANVGNSVYLSITNIGN
jgi:hypothetical protein